jgi:hypothetical protein
MLLAMGQGMVWRVISFGCLLGALAGVVLAPSAAARPQTTAPNVFVNIHVTLTDSKVIMSPKTAPRGADARFIVRNKGTKPHTFTLGANKLGADLQSGFTRTVNPNQQKILLLYLNARGALPYYGGDTIKKASPAMKGVFLVGAQCAECVPDD